MSQRISNPNQENAIRHFAGPAVILAGPGSGKTYVTVQRIRHLITHHGVDPAHILVITFTRAAVVEMRERFFHLMEPEKPPVWFGTFHAVFYHILKQSALYRDYTIITESGKRKLLKNIVQMHKRFRDIKEEDYDRLLAGISGIKNASRPMPASFDRERTEGWLSEAEIPLAELSREDFAFLISEYQRYLREFGQMDFDDIAIDCEALLTQNRAVLQKWQSRFRYILIDEFQDIAPGQYRIMKLLAAPENNIFIVGDDDQSIYRFRGASPANMRRFVKDYPQARQILLNVNYRCHQQIVEASLAVVGENKERFVKKIESSHRDGDGVCCHIFDTKEEEQAYLTDRLKEELSCQTLRQSALICRTNYDCALWAQLLAQNKIPYRLKDAPKSLFSHFVIQDLSAYLALAAGSRKRSLFLRIMNRPARYLRRDSLEGEEVSEQAWKAYYRDMPEIQDRIEELFRGLERLRSMKLCLAVRYIRRVLGYDSYLIDKYGKEQAKALLRTADEFQELVSPFAAYGELERYRQEYEETLSCRRENGGKAAGGEEQGIELLTMHASKGLEYDSVYLPGCTEGRIPSQKAETEEDLEEERRMFYVAMTRAKKNLYISAVKGKTGKEIPSRFLNPLCKT
ncbi:MAG: ATP-dependent helicase [Clostridiales bacterium]|nr:ATP-dependent helicase [Clostridiales bacterium]